MRMMMKVMLSVIVVFALGAGAAFAGRAAFAGAQQAAKIDLGGSLLCRLDDGGSFIKANDPRGAAFFGFYTKKTLVTSEVKETFAFKIGQPQGF